MNAAKCESPGGVASLLLLDLVHIEPYYVKPQNYNRRMQNFLIQLNHL